MSIIRISESIAASTIEAGSNPNETHILILEEGPGNPKNKCFYGREAVISAKEAFRGVRMFANHPGRRDMENRPEREVQDVVGRVKDTYLKETDEGKMQCWGVAKVIEGESCKWIKERINESVRAVQEGFPPIMQVSINGDGNANPRVIDGETWKYVDRISKGISVDYVPMGGIKNAGFKDLIESANLFSTSSGGSMKMKGVLTPEEQERFDRINAVIEANISEEDRKFMDTVSERLAEAEDKRDSNASAGDEPVDIEDDGTVESPTEEPVFELTMDDGTTVQVGEPDRFDPNTGVAEWDTSDGIITADLGSDETIEEPSTEEYQPAVDNNNNNNDDEVDFADLQARYPVLAAELAKDELARRHNESRLEANDLISNLQDERLKTRMERVLLESRILAERKLIEAHVPSELLTPDELVGKSPADMDKMINKALRHARFFESVVREAMTLNGGEFTRGQDTAQPGVGKRLLAAACRK